MVVFCLPEVELIMSAEKRLVEMGITLPDTPEPAANYVPWVISGKLVFLAGQVPKEGNKLKYSGQLGHVFNTQEGYEAARLCGLRLLSALRAAAGTLDRIEQIVKLTVFVNGATGFTEHPQVANGVSDLICTVFGESGTHVRSAVGSGSLPGNAAVEVEMIAQLR